MNKLISGLIGFTALVFTSCNNNVKSSHENHSDNHAVDSHVSPATTTDNHQPKKLTVAFTTTDPAISASLNKVFGFYLSIKNALASDNPETAAVAAKSLSEILANIDKSRFSAAEKPAFDKSEQGLGEHSVQIAANAGDIKLQRNHFILLSNAAYELAKNFGGNETLYHMHCPMANNNQGALWISESIEIKNPYFGSEMLTCGSVEEQIQ